MSDNWIIIIPRNPSFIPSKDCQDKAELYMKQLSPGSDSVQSIVVDKITFVDCGQNFERVICPSCKTNLTIDWWQEAMDRDYISEEFQLNKMILPCCGAKYNLNELEYDFDQGFSKYKLEAMNPNLSELSADQIKEFEKLLSTSIKIIYLHI